MFRLFASIEKPQTGCFRATPGFSQVTFSTADRRSLEMR